MAALSKQDVSFLLRRLHSLTGVVPIGGFMLFHFYENASARRGAAAFDETVVEIGQMPYLLVLEWAGLLLPILFHSVYGLFITASSRPNVGSLPWSRNVHYTLQRVTGVIGFGYLAYHITSTRMWALFVKGDHITYQDMATKFQDPLDVAIYVIGITALTYHFANGLWSFAITWGLVTSETGQRRLAYATQAFFVVLCVVGLDILSAFVFENGSVLGRLGI